MLAGLIFATEDAEGRAGTLAATLPFGGMTLIEYQARLLIAAGAAQIVVAVGRVTPALLGAVSRIGKRGVAVDIVRSAEEAAAQVHPLASLLVIADALVTTDTVVLAMAGESGDAILVTPEAPGATLERVDRGQCWAGIAILSPDRLAEVAALPREYDFQSTLLRIAAQAGAEHIGLPASARRAGHGVVRDPQVLADRSNDVLAALANQRTGWADRWFYTPFTRLILPQLVRRDVPDWGLALAGGVFGGAGMTLLALGTAGAGMALALLAATLLSTGSLLAWLRGNDRGGRRQEQAMALLAGMAALLLGGTTSVVQGHPSAIVLAMAAIVAGVLTDRAPVRPRPWYASAASQLLLVTPFALFDFATAGLVLAALHGTTSLTAAIEALRVKA